MKNLIKTGILLVIVFVIAGCQPQPTEQADPGPVMYNPNAEAHITVVQQMLDAMLAGDSTTLSAVTTDDFLDIYVTNPLDTTDKAGFIQAWLTNQTARSDQENTRVIATSMTVNEGEYVGDWVQYWGNYKARMVDADTIVLVPYFINVKMDGDKVATVYSYYDRVPIWQAVGYTITPPGQ